MDTNAVCPNKIVKTLMQKHQARETKPFQQLRHKFLTGGSVTLEATLSGEEEQVFSEDWVSFWQLLYKVPPHGS